MAKTLEQQIATALERAQTARIEIDFTHSAPDGSRAYVSSESSASTLYLVERNVDGNLSCSCQAGQHGVVCKHIGLAILYYGIEYHVDPMVLAAAARIKAFRFLDAYLATCEPTVERVQVEAEAVAAIAWQATEPTTAERAANALPVDSVPEEFSIYRS